MARLVGVGLLLLATLALAAMDPYQTLGVRRGASEAHIKRAYKKLAIQYHPDKTGGDEAATTKFVEIQAAYEALTKRPSSTPSQSQQSYYQHHYHQHQQHQQYYSYQYTSTPRQNAGGGSMLYVLIIVGLLVAFIWSQLQPEEPATVPPPPPRAPSPPPKVPTSASPFQSLAATYAPHVAELTDAHLSRRGRRTLIFCVRADPVFCSPLQQWRLMEHVALAVARDPVTCTWCDAETGAMRDQWAAFFEQQGLQPDDGFLIAIVNNTAKCAVLPPTSEVTIDVLDTWVAKLLEGQVDQQLLAMDVPVLSPIYV
ncbi:hypothetical protein SPRG_07863 [Saprolegnia parasitica CBS 223.65]|uniref:J domain-containing protein n=1 Tax=Saprolegnia parasitica (strain CBS 223.65) TaxID=695850 RepID=A0A067CKR8_SAPPC|nr:hypothetical protein SPRG_07863 [Saprolegnia parasitica CBS 223.65]KDO27156.1 hypothetical protein SPRG_07863 [Saprolegnia parasitica CBS 223.65]|eukprot:XP_012202244.1 hypothetical protein SPRG_07863 [Saprolegnia parasitica CBS 223.65]